MVANRECGPTSLPALHDSRGPTLRLYGGDPTAYVIYCRTEGDAGEERGTGDNVLYMRNRGFNRVMPFWTNVSAGARIRKRAGSQGRPAVSLQETQPKRTRRAVDMDPPQATNDGNLRNVAMAYCADRRKKARESQVRESLKRTSYEAPQELAECAVTLWAESGRRRKTPSRWNRRRQHLAALMKTPAGGRRAKDQMTYAPTSAREPQIRRPTRKERQKRQKDQARKRHASP